MGTENKDDSKPAFSWTDHKTGGIAAAIMLVASMLSTGGLHLVSEKAVHDPDCVSKSTFEREKALIEERVNSRDQSLNIEIRDRIDTRLDSRLSYEMSTVREELRRNQTRLDALLEQTARMSAILDGTNPGTVTR
jgi:hypothetical protein